MFEFNNLKWTFYPNESEGTIISKIKPAQVWSQSRISNISILSEPQIFEAIGFTRSNEK